MGGGGPFEILVLSQIGICPALQKWLGEENAKEATSAKEKRKAREECNLAAQARQPDESGGGRK